MSLFQISSGGKSPENPRELKISWNSLVLSLPHQSHEDDLLPKLKRKAKSLIATNPLVQPVTYQVKKRLSVFRPANIVMFHMGRSGSTVLGDMLNQRPDVFWDGEIYAKVLEKWEEQRTLQSQLQSFDPLSYLESRMVYADKRSYGVEINPFQLDVLKVPYSDFADALTKFGFTHYIVLERKNALRMLVSVRIARQKQSFHQPLTQQASLTKITLSDQAPSMEGPPRSLISILESYETNIGNVKQILTDRNVLYLTYDDDIKNDPYIGYQRVCDFVGLKPYPVKVKFGKTNPFPLKDIIENFSEVQEMLKDTPYAWMLDS